MDQEDDGMAGDGGSSKPGDGKRSRRAPPPTIELTATPVTNQAAAPADDSPPTAPTMGSAEPVAADAPKSASAPPPPREALKFTDPIEEHAPTASEPKRRFGLLRSWPVIAAAAAGVAITVAVALIVTGLSTGTPPTDQTLADRLAALETQIAALASRPQPVTTDPKDIAALGTRLAAIESQIGDLARRPSSAGTDPSKVAALDGRVDDLAKRLAVVEQMGRRLDEIAAQIAKIETVLAQPRPSEADPVLSNRVAAVDTAVKSLLGRVADLDKRIEALATTERETSAHPAAAAAPDRAIRLAFLATALRTAVERGEPFAAELAALEVIASDKASFASLEGFAASGVPSANALSHELSALVPALLAAATPTQGDASLMDRLGMKRLIRIRRVGDTPGDDAVSVIARIEVKAAHDDIAGALAEFAKLPESVRAPAAAWIKKATQRIAAVDATKRLTADALAGLAKPAP